MLVETILGGVTGFLGNIVTSVANYKVQKLKNEHEKAMAEVELARMDKEKEIMLAEAQANILITEVETEAQMDIADSQVFAETIKDSQRRVLDEKIHQKLLEGGAVSKAIGVILSFLFGMVDFLKRIIRPGLTIYLVGLTTWITFIAWNVMKEQQGDMTTQQAIGIFDDVTTIVIYLTVTCVTWWFGDRRMAKFLTRLNDGNIKNQASLTLPAKVKSKTDIANLDT
ncbi:MAG: hypothetical protein ACRBCI_04620 [Cellvibrionaceae bacterium]